MNTELIYVFIPIVLGYLITFFCRPSSNSNEKVSKLIPSEVFMVVWPILYILIGLSWYLARQNDYSEVSNILFWVLNVLLGSWLIIYSCLGMKRTAFYVLLLSLLFSILCYTSVPNKDSKYLIVPLIVWLIVATILSIVNRDE